MGGMVWGEYTLSDGEGGDFLTEKEKIKMLVNETPFLVTAVREGHSQTYNKDQYLVDFTNQEGEEKTVGFTKGNAERDSRLERLRTTLEEGGEPIKVKFLKIGRRYELGPAD